VRKQRVIFRPTLNSRHQIKVPGMYVRVISGAWPGWQISFNNPPADDPNTFERADALVNGEAFASNEGERFETFWIVTSTLQGSTAISEDLVLEVIDCATPVWLLNNGKGEGWRYHPIGGATLVAEVTTAATVTLYADAAWGATGTTDDATRVEYVPRGFIGGGISADGPLKVHAFQHLNKNGAQKAELAVWTAAATDLNGKYAVSFETPSLWAWPMYGLTLVLEATSAGTPIENYTWDLYSRGATS
jgi:hypothetical protein